MINAIFVKYRQVVAFGKILIVSFQGDEDEIFDTILEVLKEKEIIRLDCEYKNQAEIRYKDMVIDVVKRLVRKCNQEILLTHKEFDILHLLAKNAGRVLSKEQIYDLVWNEPYSGDYNIVMTHIHHIREKIEDDPAHPVYIQTVWGVGYKFNDKLIER